MSQHSISLKSLINIYSHYNPHNDDVFANTQLKIKRGREIFFDFDYEGDEEFKELFETEFIIKNLTENIYCLDADLFILTLKNDVQRKAPYFYKKYKAVKDLSIDDLTLGDKTVRESNRKNQDESEQKDTNMSSSTNSASSSSTGKTKSSQFPQDIETATNFDNIVYMDGGNASQNSGSSSGSSTASSNANSKRNAEFNEDYKETATRTISKVDKLALYMEWQRDVITDFVDSFNNLFMILW